MSASDVRVVQAHDSAASKLRGVGQVYTKGRSELVEMLASIRRPVTMYELLDAKPRLTQSSVYRNLAVLEEVGVVQRVASSDDRARFELTEDIIGHHHHLICLSCGGVDDFVVPPRTERTLDAALSKVIDATGFRAVGHRLDILGTCASCS